MLDHVLAEHVVETRVRKREAFGRVKISRLGSQRGVNVGDQPAGTFRRARADLQFVRTGLTQAAENAMRAFSRKSIV